MGFEGFEGGDIEDIHQAVLHAAKDDELPGLAPFHLGRTQKRQKNKERKCHPHPRHEAWIEAL